MREKYKRNKCRWLSLFFIMAGVVMILSGCGEEEMMSAGEQTQESYDSPDETAGNDTVNAQTSADGSSIMVEPVDSAEQASVAQENVEEQQLEMDEETRQQLTAELLQENELDTSVMDTRRSTRGCTFDIPEGFEESEEVDNLYVTARYPLDASMIYYEVLDGDASLQLMTEKEFKERVEGNLRQAYGEDTVINIDSYESVKISGYPAFRIMCHYEAESIRITQLEYIINADKTYAVTYSQTSDYDWMEAFEASAATIKVK